MTSLAEDISRYVPFNEQEKADQKRLLSFLEIEDDAFLRSNLTAHMTASAWVVNKSRDKVLMVYHRIYDSWSWMGGHADGCEDLLSVAVRECREESGVCAKPLSNDIFSLEILTVDGHEKKGRYVPSHLHCNVTYLLEADESSPLMVCEEENKAVRWFSLEDAVRSSSEPWFRERIYSKLNAKLSLLFGKDE